MRGEELILKRTQLGLEREVAARLDLVLLGKAPTGSGDEFARGGGERTFPVLSSGIGQSDDDAKLREIVAGAGHLRLDPCRTNHQQ